MNLKLRRFPIEQKINTQLIDLLNQHSSTMLSHEGSVLKSILEFPLKEITANFNLSKIINYKPKGNLKLAKSSFIFPEDEKRLNSEASEIIRQHLLKADLIDSIVDPHNSTSEVQK